VKGFIPIGAIIASLIFAAALVFARVRYRVRYHATITRGVWPTVLCSTLAYQLLQSVIVAFVSTVLSLYFQCRSIGNWIRWTSTAQQQPVTYQLNSTVSRSMSSVYAVCTIGLLFALFVLLTAPYVKAWQAVQVRKYKRKRALAVN
jgi:hypothetical protein